MMGNANKLVALCVLLCLLYEVRSQEANLKVVSTEASTTEGYLDEVKKFVAPLPDEFKESDDKIALGRINAIETLRPKLISAWSVIRKNGNNNATFIRYYEYASWLALTQLPRGDPKRQLYVKRLLQYEPFFDKAGNSNLKPKSKEEFRLVILPEFALGLSGTYQFPALDMSPETYSVVADLPATDKELLSNGGFKFQAYADLPLCKRFYTRVSGGVSWQQLKSIYTTPPDLPGVKDEIVSRLLFLDLEMSGGYQFGIRQKAEHVELIQVFAGANTKWLSRYKKGDVLINEAFDNNRVLHEVFFGWGYLWFWKSTSFGAHMRVNYPLNRLQGNLNNQAAREVLFDDFQTVESFKLTTFEITLTRGWNIGFRAFPKKAKPRSNEAN